MTTTSAAGRWTPRRVEKTRRRSDERVWLDRRVKHDITVPQKAKPGDAVAIVSPSFAAPEFFPAIHEQALQRLTAITGGISDNPKELEAAPVSVRIKLSSLWVSVMFCFIYAEAQAGARCVDRRCGTDHRDRLSSYSRCWRPDCVTRGGFAAGQPAVRLCVHRVADVRAATRRGDHRRGPIQTRRGSRAACAE